MTMKIPQERNKENNMSNKTLPVKCLLSLCINIYANPTAAAAIYYEYTEFKVFCLFDVALYQLQ